MRKPRFYDWSLRRTVFACVGLLSVVALLAAGLRTASITSVLGVAPADRPEWTPADRLMVESSTKLLGLEPGTARYAQLVAAMRRVVDKFISYSGAGLLHLIPGMIFILLAPLQFSGRIRAQRPGFHRWLGRVLVTVGVVIGLTGIFFGVIFPTYGLTEAFTISIIAGAFFFCLTRAVIEIRRHRVAQHREWMIRTYAATLAVATTRLVSAPLVAILVDPKAAMIASFWAGWLITLCGAEMWIRHTRPRNAVGVPIVQPVFGARSITAP